MQRRSPKRFLLLALLLLSLFILPALWVERIRASVVSLLSPSPKSLTPTEREKILQLEAENLLLHRELDQWQLLCARFPHLEEKREIIPAHVLYRDPSSWASSLWINVGSATHPQVAKESPVLVGKNLIGVLDRVEPHRARVRLLTDSGVTPSVRVLRNATYLAKGVLEGGGEPLWRSRGLSLRGRGFNYAYPDEKGPPRSPEGIVHVGDLLVTTGLDGVFPEGLHVARVTRLSPFKEGDVSYDLEAVPTAGDLDALSTVFVLPPRSRS